MTYDELELILFRSCTDLGSTGYDEDYGLGMPNALRGMGRRRGHEGDGMLLNGIDTHSDCREWSAFRSGVDDPVERLAVFDDGNGPALFVGGWFTAAGGVSANHIARWNGSSWSALGTGIDDGVWALTVFDDGTGPALFAGGYFTTAGGVSAHNIAKWNGSSWSALGTGMDDEVRVLTVHDDGTGPALYAGGYFTKAGGVSANYIAKWNGSTWSSLGTGMNDGSWVYALTGFDDGTGPALYAGGWFGTAGGISARCIARWNGSAWSALGTGTSNTVGALAVFDDGTGPALYAGGWFTTAGGMSANRIARWRGSAWSALGTGMPAYSAVTALTVFDAGTGPALYAGGSFTTAGGVAANRVARWNGFSWSKLGAGLSGGEWDGWVRALTVFNDGTGAALYAGGYFTESGGRRTPYIARWGCTGLRSPGACTADINSDGRLDVNDFIAFQAAWCAEDPRADWNGDGAFTIADYIAFQAAFARGCP